MKKSKNTLLAALAFSAAINLNGCVYGPPFDPSDNANQNAYGPPPSEYRETELSGSSQNNDYNEPRSLPNDNNTDNSNE